MTFTRCPAISVPVGAQIVGERRGDWARLQLAHAVEQATARGKRRPTFT